MGLNIALHCRTARGARGTRTGREMFGAPVARSAHPVPLRSESISLRVKRTFRGGCSPPLFFGG
jgi:hypothetical protein